MLSKVESGHDGHLHDEVKQDASERLPELRR